MSDFYCKLRPMRYLAGFGFLATLTLSGLFLFRSSTININSPASVTGVLSGAVAKPAGEEPSHQKPLAEPPAVVKAIYATAWSAGSSAQASRLIKLIEETELNAVVIDIKDYSGRIGYDVKNGEVEKYGAEEIKIPDLAGLINRFHDKNIYVIGRITVFQDPILAKARPDLAIHSKTKCRKSNTGCKMLPSTLWFDRKKLAWIDPAAKEAWNYNAAIAKDAAAYGFDELNFDYIRFASDGDLDDMFFPFWDEKNSKREVIREFFKYLREELAGVKISADVFGMTAVAADDLGIGQMIEDTYEYFDFVAPMIYPSHFSAGVFGLKNPAKYPYETAKYSIGFALQKLSSSTAGRRPAAKLRPWLQDFDLGTNYDAGAVKKQIQGVYDAASGTPESINGWMLWDSANVYTKEALAEE